MKTIFYGTSTAHIGLSKRYCSQGIKETPPGNILKPLLIFMTNRTRTRASMYNAYSQANKP